MQLLASLGLSGSPHLKVASDRATIRQVHFQHAAPEKQAYAINRYRREMERHHDALALHLKVNPSGAN